MVTLVKTSQVCFVNGCRYYPGDVFELPEGKKPGRYMTVVKGEAPKAKPKTRSEAPVTLSEITAKDAKAMGDQALV